MSFPQYARYKDSGVEWLGEVPEHWGIRALKRIVSTPITDGPHETPVFLDEGIPFASAESVSSGILDFGKIRAFISRVDHERYAEKYLPRRNDIFMVKSGATTGITAIVDTDIEFNIWSPLAAIRCSKIANPFFVLYYLRSTSFLDAVALSWSFGTQQNIGMGVIENLPVLVPPTQEQDAIASFLREEVGKIDGLIEEQRQLIELLKEKRQAVISLAVTKGLNQATPLKDSGYEWLGPIPVHWSAGQLTRFASRIVVGIAEAATHAYSDEGVPILRSTNIRPNRIIGDILRISPEFANERETKLIHSRDLVTVRTGNAGVTAVVPEELDGCHCFTMLITTLREGVIPEFYSYLLNSDIAISYFLVEGWGTAQVNISVPILKSLPVPVPPMVEQQAIVEHLDAELDGFDRLIKTAEDATELLQERRSALISAAVTGKIDVRSAVPSEGTELEEAYEPA